MDRANKIGQHACSGGARIQSQGGSPFLLPPPSSHSFFFLKIFSFLLLPPQNLQGGLGGFHGSQGGREGLEHPCTPGSATACCFSLWLLLITVPWWPHYGNILVLIYGLRSCQDHEITIQSSYCCRASNLCTMVIVAYKKSSNSNYFHNCAFLHIMLRLHNFVFPYHISAIY